MRPAQIKLGVAGETSWLAGLVFSMTIGLAVSQGGNDDGKTIPPPRSSENPQPDRPALSSPRTTLDDATQKELQRLRAELEEWKRSRLADSPAPGSAPSSAAAPRNDGAHESADAVAERARLKARLFELLEQIPTRRMPTPAAPAVAPTPELNSENFRPVDRIRYLQNLMKAGQYATALRAFQVMDPANLSGKQGAMLRYLQASAHRRAGDLDAAKKLYAELAQSREDEFLAECAAWHLQALRTREELTGRLDTSRAGRRDR